MLPLLESLDAPPLANGGRLPPVLACPCFTRFHHDPHTESLAAALLTAGSEGTVAVRASSG